jgi:MraZ protein
MFAGQFEHNIDEKGRITFPSRFREMLADGAYLTRGLEKNLILMPTATFTRISESVSTMNSLDPKVIGLNQFLFGNATPIEFDSAGRFVIPQFLRDFAQLQSSVTVVGNNTNIALWAPERWAEKQKLFDNIEAVGQLFDGLNLSF